MAQVTLTTPTLSNPASKAEVETNFNDILTGINGNLGDDNLVAGAGIATSKLAARDYEFLVQLKVSPTTAVAPPTSATVPIDVVALPGSASDGYQYTVISGSYYINDDGDLAATTTFEVQLGYATAGPPGAWTQVGTDIVGATNITGSGQGQDSAAVAIATAAITLGATPYFLGLFLTALGANALNAAHSFLVVTLKLRRTDGLRGT